MLLGYPIRPGLPWIQGRSEGHGRGAPAPRLSHALPIPHVNAESEPALGLGVRPLLSPPWHRDGKHDI